MAARTLAELQPGDLIHGAEVRFSNRPFAATWLHGVARLDPDGTLNLFIGDVGADRERAASMFRQVLRHAQRLASGCEAPRIRLVGMAVLNPRLALSLTAHGFAREELVAPLTVGDGRVTAYVLDVAVEGGNVRPHRR